MYISTNLSAPAVNAYEVFAAQLFEQFQITAICNGYVINSQANAKLFSNPHLQFLQLRASIVVHILVDVHVRYPNLKVLDISHNFENFLLGLTAIGIVGAVVHEKNKRDRQRRAVTRTQPVYDTYDQPRHKRYKHKKHVHKHKRRHTARLPNVCLRQRWTENGWVQYYGKRCLRRHGY